MTANKEKSNEQETRRTPGVTAAHLSDSFVKLCVLPAPHLEEEGVCFVGALQLELAGTTLTGRNFSQLEIGGPDRFCLGNQLLDLLLILVLQQSELEKIASSTKQQACSHVTRPLFVAGICMYVQCTSAVIGMRK